jgi:pyruvate kinase
MLESMMATPSPTRAEASDVANAVFDGTDAVMLSGETASGQYPIETVQTMTRIVMEAERVNETGRFRADHAHHFFDPFNTSRETALLPGSVVDAIEHSASQIARQVGAVAIACLTHTGMAARTLAKYRPSTPIVAIMDNEESLRKLAFVWGVRGELIPKIVGTDDLFAMVEKVLQTHSWAEAEDLVVVTAGIPTLRRGTTNMIKVHRMGVPTDRGLSR